MRDAIAADFQRRYGMQVDPETQLTVCCGSTEAMMATMLAIVDPGDEVIVFEPFYENYGPDAILSGATPRFVPLRPPADAGIATGRSTPTSCARRFQQPHARDHHQHAEQPDRQGLHARGARPRSRELCQQWGAIAVTDEIYEHILYDGAVHMPMATLDGMADRTVTINSVSKTFSVTGWRVGWAIAPAGHHAARSAKCTTS